MSSTARDQRSDKKRTNDAILNSDAQLIQGLKLFSDVGSVSGQAGQSAQNSPGTPAGNYLAREGDSMIGPLALGPPVDFTIDIDANNTINISPLNENAHYSSNLQLEDVPISDVLDIIAGDAFDGQLLILRTFAPPVGGITISQMTLGNGGNIQTPDGNDFVIGDLQMIALVYDEALLNIAANSGTWRVLPGFGGAGGSPEVLDNLNEKDHGDNSLQLITMDWQEANFHRYRATGDNQIVFSNEPGAGKWEPLIIQITQDGVGGHLQNFNDAPFANGTPIIDTNPNAVTSLRFYNYFDGVSNVIYWSFWDTQSNQTPWLSNIDANKFILFNLNEVIFDNTVINAPVVGKHSLFWSFSSGDQVMQIQPGNDFKIIQGDNELASQTVATFNESTIDFSIQTLPFTVLEVGDMLVKGISQFNDNMTLKTNNVVFPQPNFSPSNSVAGANDGGDLGTQTRNWNNLNIRQIRLRDGAVIIDIASIAFDSAFNGTVYNVPNGNSHLFKQFDGVASTDTLFEINETEIDAWTKNIVNVVDPVAPQDAATKAYVDANSGNTWKIPVRAKADGFTFLFPNIQSVIDGVLLAQGDRVLLTDELNGKNNGIWEVAGPFAGIPLQAPLIRPSDFNSDAEMVSQVTVAVEEGDINAYSVWQLRTPNPIIDNVTSQDWGNLRPGGITDVFIGTKDVANVNRTDDQREWFGCNNGSDGIGNVLGTTEPAGTNWTFSYTITSSDLPSMSLGWGIPTDYGMFGSAQFENVGAAASLSSKWFINGVQIASNGGSINNQYAGRTAISQRNIVVGDTIQLKAWCATGDNASQTLEAFGIYVFPGVVQCEATSITILWPEDDTNDLKADYPVGVAASTFDERSYDQYLIGGLGDLNTTGAFVGFYASDQNRLLYGEAMALQDTAGSSGSYDSATKAFMVPLAQYLANYRTVNK